MDYDKVPERWGDPQQRCPDISRARKLLNWEPQVSFAEGLKKTLVDFQSRLNNKTRIAVFAPSYHPIEGPAELAVKEITDRLLAYEIDLFVAKMKPGLARKETIGNVTVRRLGMGNKWDKYLLPILASRKAKQLHKSQDYQAAWGIMASYGAVAAALFSLKTKRAFLVSLFEGKVKDTDSIRRKFLKPFYRLIFKRAHNLQIVGELS